MKRSRCNDNDIIDNNGYGGRDYYDDCQTAREQVGWEWCMDKDDAFMMMTTTTTTRTWTTKERDGNLLPPVDAAQGKDRGLPQTGTTVIVDT